MHCRQKSNKSNQYRWQNNQATLSLRQLYIFLALCCLKKIQNLLSNLYSTIGFSGPMANQLLKLLKCGRTRIISRVFDWQVFANIIFDIAY